MQTRPYDTEESFRAMLLVLIENGIKFIKQEAFDKCLVFVNEYLQEKYDINCVFLGSNKFKEFTNYSRNKFTLFNNNQLAVIRKIKEDEIKEGLYHKKMLESAQCEKCLSVFGLSSSKELNEKNFCNTLNDIEKLEIKNYLEIREGTNNCLLDK